MTTNSQLQVFMQWVLFYAIVSFAHDASLLSKARVLQVSTNVKYRAPLLSPQKQFKKKITLSTSIQFSKTQGGLSFGIMT
jgi:hypothetical protein